MPRSSPPSCPGAPQHTQEPPDMPRSLPMTHPGAPPHHAQELPPAIHSSHLAASPPASGPTLLAAGP